MITVESLLSIDKNDLPEASKVLSPDDIAQLIDWLNEKDDKIRYQSLLLLKYRSQYADDVYPFWDLFCGKFRSENSYQRSIGLTLISENVRWDTADKMNHTIDDYLLILKDEKPITVRQCIQALTEIVSEKPKLCNKTAVKLMSVNLSEQKDTMRKLILMDILNVLIGIYKNNIMKDEIGAYISNALTGEILDKKAKKQIEALL